MSDTSEKQIAELKMEAMSYCKLTQYSKAENSIKKALEISPQSKDLIHELSKIYLIQKKLVIH